MYLTRKYAPAHMTQEASVMTYSPIKGLVEEDQVEEISIIIAFTIREEGNVGDCDSGLVLTYYV